MKLRKSAGSLNVTLVAAAAITTMALLLASCQKVKDLESHISSTGGDVAPSSSGGGSTPPAPIGTFTVTPGGNLAAFNLGTSQSFPVTIKADSNFSGNVSLGVTESELQVLDKGLGIGFTVTPSSVSLTPNSSAQVMVTVNVSTLSPSFKSSLFHVVANDISHPVGTAFVSSVPVALQVNAVFDVLMLGGASPGKWNTGKVTSFINHPEGLLVRFNNLDKVSTHIVHSAGPIPHGDTNKPLVVSPDGVSANPTGGIYQTLVTQQTSVSDLYYYHDIGASSGDSRTLVFNQPVVVPSPSPSNNPNAKFTYINNTIFKVSCVSCHNAANKQGSVDLSTYTSVKAALTAGNSMISPLYLAVAPGGGMPQGASPLSADLVKDVQDWIDSGALNN